VRTSARALRAAPDLSALLHEPMRCLNILRSRRWNIFLNVCQGILTGLYGPATRLSILLRSPSLELHE
jgi:hypothetical protein